MALHQIFADESRQTGHTYMFYGMIILPATDTDLENRISYLRSNHKYGSDEVKWNHLSKGKLDLYKSLVDAFHQCQTACFRCMKIEPCTIDRHKYHDGDRETAFYWGYDMALSRNLELSHGYEIFVDARTDEKPNRIADLRSSINAHWIQKQLAENLTASEIVRDIKSVDSKRHNILQVADLLTGAVGFSMEKRDARSNTSVEKMELIAHITNVIGCECLATHHGLESRFNIWDFRFRTEEEKNEYEERQKKEKLPLTPTLA